MVFRTVRFDLIDLISPTEPPEPPRRQRIKPSPQRHRADACAKFGGLEENFAFPVAHQPRLMSALIEPIDLEAGAIFLPAPAATALHEEYVHVRPTITTARMSWKRGALQTLGVD